MKLWLTIILLTALNIASAVMLWSQSGRRGVEGESSLALDSRAATIGDGSDASLEIRKLALRVRRLESEVAALRAPSGSANSSAGGLVEPDAPYAGDELEDGPPQQIESAVIEALESYDPQIRDRLRAVIQEEQERLREEEMKARRERWEERARQRLAELAEQAELSSTQLSFVEERLRVERDEMHELFLQARRNHDFAGVREKVSEIRRATDDAIRGELDDEQTATYDAMREEEMARFGGPRRRGRATAR